MTVTTWMTAMRHLFPVIRGLKVTVVPVLSRHPHIGSNMPHPKPSLLSLLRTFLLTAPCGLGLGLTGTLAHAQTETEDDDVIVDGNDVQSEAESSEAPAVIVMEMTVESDTVMLDENGLPIPFESLSPQEQLELTAQMPNLEQIEEGVRGIFLTGDLSELTANGAVVRMSVNGEDVDLSEGMVFTDASGLTPEMLAELPDSIRALLRDPNEEIRELLGMDEEGFSDLQPLFEQLRQLQNERRRYTRGMSLLTGLDLPGIVSGGPEGLSEAGQRLYEASLALREAVNDPDALVNDLRAATGDRQEATGFMDAAIDDVREAIRLRVNHEQEAMLVVRGNLE